MPENSFNDDEAQRIGYYVYAYSDPRTNTIFYVGKGKGNRVFNHLNEHRDSQKSQKIVQIQQAGYEPHIEFLRYGLTDSEASLVEATFIDFLGLETLTNLVNGGHASYPRISILELKTMFSAKPIEVTEKAILITINKLYRPTMTERELYEATRGVWRIGERRNNAEYAMAVYQGIVREVYKIDCWYTSGTLKYQTRDDSTFDGLNRWEFSGEVDDELKDKYLNGFVGMGSQNPIRYVNC